MVKDRLALAAVVTGVALALGLAWARLPAQALAAPVAATGLRAVAAGVVEVPAIDLARIDRSAAGPDAAGGRNLFEFDSVSRLPPTTTLAPPPPLALPEPTERTEPAPPAVPPFGVKYIGTLQNKQGLKVAVLMTDHKEILTGQAGEVVANRLKIVRIGLESVDVQDVSGGAVRRIPLRGNQ